MRRTGKLRVSFAVEELFFAVGDGDHPPDSWRAEVRKLVGLLQPRSAAGPTTGPPKPDLCEHLVATRALFRPLRLALRLVLERLASKRGAFTKERRAVVRPGI